MFGEWEWTELTKRFASEYQIQYPHLPWVIIEPKEESYSSDDDDDYYDHIYSSFDKEIEQPVSQHNGLHNLTSLYPDTPIHKIIELCERDGLHIIDARWEYLSMFGNIEDIIKYPNLPWDMEFISGNKTVTLDYIKMHPRDWDYNSLSMCINISEIRKDLSLNWNRYYLSLNDSLTFEDILSLS